MLPSLDALQDFLNRCSGLYSLPAIAAQVLELTRRPNVDVKALRECVQRDPALTCRILRVTNSSLYGLAHPISDLGQAIALLGINPLKLLVLGFSLPIDIGAQGGEAPRHYWRKTLYKATAAHELARRRKQPADEAFLAGLLQDLGSLVLLQQLGEAYARLINRVQQGEGDLLHVEREALGFDHIQLTVRLLTSWQFPGWLVSAVAAASPATVDDAAIDPLVGLLRQAELLSQWLTDGRRSALIALLREQSTVQSPADELTDLLAKLQTQMTELAEVLAMDLDDPSEMRQMLIEAHAELAQAALDAATTLVSTHYSGAAMPGEVQALSTALSHFIQHPASPPAISAASSNRPVAKPRMASGTAVAEPAIVASPVHEALVAASDSCRLQRVPLSLVLFDASAMTTTAEKLCRAGELSGSHVVRQICMRLSDHPITLVELPGKRFAAVLANYEREQAVAWGRKLLAVLSGGNASPEKSISLGIATAAVLPKNFHPDDLLQSAARCLNAALRSGGGLKSIGV